MVALAFVLEHTVLASSKPAGTKSCETSCIIKASRSEIRVKPQAYRLLVVSCFLYLCILVSYLDHLTAFRVTPHFTIAMT